MKISGINISEGIKERFKPVAGQRVYDFRPEVDKFGEIKSVGERTFSALLDGNSQETLYVIDPYTKYVADSLILCKG